MEERSPAWERIAARLCLVLAAAVVAILIATKTGVAIRWLRTADPGSTLFSVIVFAAVGVGLIRRTFPWSRP